MPKSAAPTTVAPLACGHPVDALQEYAKYPGGRRVYRCSKCKAVKR